MRSQSFIFIFFSSLAFRICLNMYYLKIIFSKLWNETQQLCIRFTSFQYYTLNNETIRYNTNSIAKCECVGKYTKRKNVLVLNHFPVFTILLHRPWIVANFFFVDFFCIYFSFTTATRAQRSKHFVLRTRFFFFFLCRR